MSRLQNGNGVFRLNSGQVPDKLIDTIIDQCDQTIQEIKALDYRNQATKLRETVNFIRKTFLQEKYNK